MRSALLLASGISRRMGPTNKLSLPYKGVALLNHVLYQLGKSKVEEIIIVISTQNLKFLSIPSITGVRLVINHAPLLGMTYSMKLGINLLDARCAAAMVCLADMPLITPQDYSQLWIKYDQAKKHISAPIVRPVSINNKPGNPVIFHRKYFTDLSVLTLDEKPRKIPNVYGGSVINLQTSKEAFFTDIDEIEDYKKLNV